MKKLINIFLAIAFFSAVISLSGCSNTLDGVGKDLEELGEKIQDRK